MDPAFTIKKSHKYGVNITYMDALATFFFTTICHLRCLCRVMMSCTHYKLNNELTPHFNIQNRIIVKQARVGVPAMHNMHSTIRLFGTLVSSRTLNECWPSQKLLFVFIQ